MSRRARQPQLDQATAESADGVAARSEGMRYVLRLYVTGTTLRSMQAIANLRAIGEMRLRGRCELQVVDIYRQPRLARHEQIVAAPTLIKKLPLPLRRILGDLSEEESVLMGLDLRVKGA